MFIVKENHTFDNLFGSFPGAEGTSTALTSKGPIKAGRPPILLTRDLCHSHDCALADWDSGKLDGLVVPDDELTDLLPRLPGAVPSRIGWSGPAGSGWRALPGTRAKQPWTIEYRSSRGGG